jgi:hypothetical protein
MAVSFICDAFAAASALAIMLADAYGPSGASLAERVALVFGSPLGAAGKGR